MSMTSSNVSATCWENEFRKLEMKVTKFRVATASGSNPSDIAANARDQQMELNFLKEQIQVLLNITMQGSSSNNSSEVITPDAELAKRKSMLDSLEKRVNDLISRCATLQAPPSPVARTRKGVSKNTGLISLQREAMEQQDEQLRTLSQGLTNMTRQGSLIGQEADLQAALLDDMDGDINDLESSMAKNIENARFLREKTNYNVMYMWIAGLSALLFVQIMLKVSG